MKAIRFHTHGGPEVLVYEDGETRCMCFTVRCSKGRQTCIYVKNPDQLALGYSTMMLV